MDARAFTERTALAWNRSALALAALGAIAVRAGERTGRVALGAGLAAVLFTGATAVWVYGDRLYRSRRDGADATPAQRERALGVLTAATVLMAVVALALALPA